MATNLNPLIALTVYTINGTVYSNKRPPTDDLALSEHFVCFEDNGKTIVIPIHQIKKVELIYDTN